MFTTGFSMKNKSLAEKMNGKSVGWMKEMASKKKCVLTGSLIIEEKNPHTPFSILAAGFENNIPVTVHVALGTDIIHMHPSADGKALGDATFHDYRKLTDVICGLDGGVWINVGCAVILPEVFLKAVSVARNLGAKLDAMTTANLDMLRQYRAETNVVQRPPGRGISILGQHELMLPLLRMAVLCKLAEAGWRPAPRS